MQGRLTAIATAGALLNSAGISLALAGVITQPGETVGIALARTAGTQVRPVASRLGDGSRAGITIAIVASLRT
jgi:hypothetical protein